MLEQSSMRGFTMTEKYFFADVNLPFHVWVKEGCRWVLRDAGAKAQALSPAGLAADGKSSGIEPSAA
jgi:hypothetical protein